MFDRIRLKNFKGHTDTVLEPKNLAVLVGPNGSGKTSLLQAVHLLSQLSNTTSTQLFKAHTAQAPYFLFSRNARFPLSVEVGNRGAKQPWTVAFGLRPDGKNADLEETGWEARTVWASGEGAEQTSEWEPDLALGRKLPSAVLNELKATAYYRFDPRQLASPAYSEQRIPRVEFDGEGLATVVAYLMTAQRKVFDQLREALRSVVPSLVDIRVKPALIHRRVTEFVEAGDTITEVEKTLRVSGHELWFDFKTASDVPAHSASDGTLIALGLLAVLFSPNRPRVVLLDDLEQSLHPAAQTRLVEQIREVLRHFPDLQIIATTHSPYLVDSLTPDEVWLVHHNTSGILKCRSLAQHPRAERSLQILTTGEFWAAEGEDWGEGADNG